MVFFILQMYTDIGVLHVGLYKCSISQILHIYMYLHVKMEEQIEMLEWLWRPPEGPVCGFSFLRHGKVVCREFGKVVCFTFVNFLLYGSITEKSLKF